MEEGYAYRGRRISVRIYEATLPNGRKAWTEAVEHPGAVVIIPRLPGERYVVLRQYRRVVGEWLIEFPAGTLEPGEPPEKCALRELEEETGYIARSLRLLAKLYTTPGYSTEALHFYLAENLEKGTMRPEPTELIKIQEKTLNELEDMALKGEIRDMKTIAALELIHLHEKAPR